MMKNVDFSFETINPKLFLGTREIQFWQRCRSFHAKNPKTISSTFKSDNKSIFFFRKNFFFLKMFQWTRRLQFRQPLINFLDKNRESFAHCQTKLKKLSFFLKKKSFTKCFYGNDECSFDNTYEKFLTKGLHLIAQNPKKEEEEVV